MNEKDFDSGLQNLLSAERKSLPYALVSLEAEQRALIEAFYDHYTTLSMESVEDVFSDEMRPSDFYDDDEDFDDSYPELTERLEELLEERAYAELKSGELCIAGEGGYIILQDEDIPEDEDALVGGYLIGENPRYSAAPLGLNSREALPGLWVELERVTVYSASGEEEKALTGVIMPVSGQEVRLAKVLRQDGSTLAPPEIKRKPLRSDLWVHFKNSEIVERCNDIENYFKYGQFSSEEEFEAFRAFAQAEISLHMMDVDKTAPIMLSIERARYSTGKLFPFLLAAEAQYVGPDFMQIENIGRVVQQFVFKVDDRDLNLYVLPQDIVDAAYKHKQ